MLGHAPVHAPDLEEREEHGGRPGPEDPADPEPRPGHAVERLETGLARRDRVAPQLRLDGRLDRAAQEHDPQRHVARLGAESRGGDQLPGPDDGGGEHHARAEPRERAPRRRRRLLDVLGPQRVGIEPHTRATGLRSSPRSGEESTTSSPSSSPDPSGWMMPVPVERTVPVRIRSSARASPRAPRNGASAARGRLAREDLTPAAQDAAAELDRVRVGYLVRRDDRGPEREAPLVHLRLREVRGLSRSMSQAETSLAKVNPRIAPLRPRTIAISGSAAVKEESRRRPMGSPWATHREAVALKKSSGRSAEYTRS